MAEEPHNFLCTPEQDVRLELVDQELLLVLVLFAEPTQLDVDGEVIKVQQLLEKRFDDMMHNLAPTEHCAHLERPPVKVVDQATPALQALQVQGG